MKVFLAGETSIAREPAHKDKVAPYLAHRLFSFWYHGFKSGTHTADVLDTLALGAELFLDSGAFTAFTKNVEIPIEGYARFIRENGHAWAVRANLDVIGDDGAKSWANLKELEALGASVFPVYHYGDDERWLTRILDEGYEFFALGGLVGASRKVLVEWLDRIWARYLIDSTGRPRRKVHGFGLTDQVLMLRYPWFSVDSASWIFSGNFGTCLFARKGGLMNVSFSDQSPDLRNERGWAFRRLSPAAQDEVRSWFAGTGYTPEDCERDYLARFAINARAYTELGKLAATQWKPVQETLF